MRAQRLSGVDRLAEVVSPRLRAFAGTKLETVKSPLTTTGEQLTSLEDITHYNNFYEFGVERTTLQERRRTAHAALDGKVEGKVKKPKTFDIDALLKLRPLEERVYRHRCVEAWSMVIPWVGYSLSEFIKQCDPLPSAKYVQFLSYYDKHVEKWASESTIFWPYSEGLRMDEAMNPLTLLTFGLYGEVLPNQDGAPVRIVVPWKYGFKSAKSIVTVRFVDKQPSTTWNEQAPQRVRLLLQRESQLWTIRAGARRPNAASARHSTAAPQDPDVQRLWRPGRLAVQRNGSEEVLLTPPMTFAARSKAQGAGMTDARTRKKQLACFIAKYTPEIGSLAVAIRAEMRKRYPSAIELVYDNYNALAIGYCPTEKTSEAIFSIALLPRWVSLFFLQAQGLARPRSRPEGQRECCQARGSPVGR